LQPTSEKPCLRKSLPDQQRTDAEYLGQLLLEARGLIESTLSLQQKRLIRPPSVIRKNSTYLPGALERLVGGAQHSVAVALPESGNFEKNVLRTLSRNASQLVVRVLRWTQAEKAWNPWLQLPQKQVDARVNEGELRRLLVVDGTVALVQAPTDAPDGQLTVVNDAAAVRVLELHFAAAWSHGRRIVDHLRFSPRMRTDMTRSILELLRDGNTDETAARKMNVSLRTYRRHVA
jgi:hypothetical protein